MKARARATDATHSEIKNTGFEKETTIKGNKGMRYTDTRACNNQWVGSINAVH